MLDHETIWRETLANDSVTENESRSGRQLPAEVDQQMLHDIQVILSRLVAKARQLIRNFTTNLAEGWMNIRCKFDGGKVVNRSQSGSWEHRCAGAGLQQNLGRSWGPEAWEKMTCSPPNQVFVDTAELSSRKVDETRKRRSTEVAKECRRRSKYSNTDKSVAARRAYSRHDDDITPSDNGDLSPHHLDELKDSYYRTNIRLSGGEAQKLEEERREQGGSELWIRERMKQITASHVGGILKMKKTTKRSRKVEALLYSKFKGNQATLYGTNMEDTTRQEYTEHQHQAGHPGLKTSPAGLTISVQNPWLGASPDGKVLDPSASKPDGIVEYKNPYSARDLSLEEACCTKKLFCLEKLEDNGKVTFKLKRRHDYYYQIQCQMYCCDVDWCDFVLRTKKEIHVERIPQDSDWLENQLPKLNKFFYRALLPELACPRRNNGGIIEPADI